MLKIKHFRQSKSTCGPACLRMILQYYNIKASEKKLIKLTKCTKEKGTSAKNLIKAAHYFNIKGKIIDNATFSDINRHINRKIPVIVNWFSTDEGHYSVVIGIDKKYIYLLDPELGKKPVKINLPKFKKVWFDFPNSYIKSKSDIVLRRIIVIYN